MLNKHRANNESSCAICNAEMIAPFAVDETGVAGTSRCAHEKPALPQKNKNILSCKESSATGVWSSLLISENAMSSFEAIQSSLYFDYER